MKVLFVANGFPPQRWAGTETYTAGIAKEIKRRNFSVQVLCCGEWDEGPSYWNGYEDDAYNGIPVRRLNLNWSKAQDPNTYLYANPVVGEHLDRYLQEIRPDLVHVTSCETLSACVLDVVKRRRIPLVLSITDFWFLCPKINLLRSDGENCDGITTPWECLRCKVYDTKVYRLPRSILSEKSVESLLTTASKFPFVSRQPGFRGLVVDIAERKKYLHHAFSLPDIRLTASAFIRDVYFNGGFHDQIKVHPYGHDLSWLEKHQDKLPSTKIRIGFIGQIVHSKGVHLLLEAVSQLEDDIKEKITLSIYGDLQKDAQYGCKLQELAHSLANVEFSGTYPHAESANVFSRIDVLVVPSLWYDFPLIIEEAFATKTPVVATRLGHMAETVIDGINGLLFERGNSAELAEQIERLVLEPDLLRRLAGKISAVKTVEQEGLELENIYQGLLA